MAFANIFRIGSSCVLRLSLGVFPQPIRCRLPSFPRGPLRRLTASAVFSSVITCTSVVRKPSRDCHDDATHGDKVNDIEPDRPLYRIMGAVGKMGSVTLARATARRRPSPPLQGPSWRQPRVKHTRSRYPRRSHHAPTLPWRSALFVCRGVTRHELSFRH